MSAIYVKLADLVGSYGAAINTARKRHGLTALKAAKSVFVARLRYGIGPRFHSLFELYSQPEETWGSYLLDEPLKVMFRRLNPASLREVVNDKLRFAEHCSSLGIENIPLVCAIDRSHKGPDPSGRIVQTREDWCRLIDAGPNELFLKLIDGTWGLRVFSAKRESAGLWQYCGESGSASDLYSFAMDRLEDERGWIVQPRIRPHQQLQSIMSPHGLGTFRVVTALRDGAPRILFAVLRLPVGANGADNFVHGQSGNLIAAVDAETGVLGRARTSLSREWPSIVDADQHPETGQRITGVHVPYWNELKDLVLRAHSSLPGLITLGWDIAVTDYGPLVVEANGTYDVDILQVALKKGVRFDLDFLR